MTISKSSIVCVTLIVLVISLATGNYGQKIKADYAEVPLTNPGKSALVNVKVFNGSITVTGYSGEKIIVEAKLGSDHEDKHNEESETDEHPQKNKGMYLIKNHSTGLNITEENNIVDISLRSMSQKVDANIKVPFSTSLKLKAFQSGKINVEKINGELEVNHHNGPIMLKNISGTVIANSFNGDLTVTFDKIDLDKPMSFTTFNGDIDVTFPKNAKFNLKMKSEQGEIYSDFKLDMKPSEQGKKKTERKDGKYLIKFDKTLYGLLNGGGEEIQFKTFNGDIYIREKK